MQTRRIAIRIANSRSAPLLVLALMALGAVLAPPFVSKLVIVALALTAIGWIARLNAVLHGIRRRVAGPQTAADESPARTVDAEFSKIEHQLESLRHRMLDAHPVSGLPVREALVQQIGRERQGYLGVIALKDVDRLCAFDPALADRVVAACSQRLRSMLPATRFLAQIGRGHIGVWFGKGMSDAEAWAELDAVAYALGAEVADGETQIIPQISFRLSAFDASAGMTPAAFVARALACLALPPGEVSAVIATDEDEEHSARDRFTLEQDLRQAIDRRELHLLYQPLVDASRGCVDGAEALIRWEHPARGVVAPSAFVPLLERIGLADEIGIWALNTAIREAQRWDAIGIAAMRVAVNVSGLQLQGDDLPRVIQRTLQHHGVSAARLEIELTESVATSDAAHCREIFEALRALGVKLAVDDFGTGYSGFSSLRTLAFDKIKIDREFVTDVDSRGDSQAICQSIIALGRGLGIRVLAEGVERHEEYAWLRQHGCHHFQGYYFGRPMQGAELTAFARDRDAIARLLAPHDRLERLTA